MVLLIISLENSLCVFDLCYNEILIYQIAYKYVTGFAKTVPIGTTIEIHFMA